MDPSSSISGLSDDDAQKQRSSLEIIEIEDVTPPPPPLPLIELVIIYIINRKEAGERSLEVDVNQEFQSFQLQLARFIKPKLPQRLSIYSDGVDVSYKRAYVTKAQEAKRKELTWKDFADEMDYSGLLNAIRNSKASKMTLLIRAFIIVPKEDFDVDIEPVIASQRVVSSVIDLS
jgi:hypothetical protein